MPHCIALGSGRQLRLESRPRPQGLARKLRNLPGCPIITASLIPGSLSGSLQAPLYPTGGEGVEYVPNLKGTSPALCAASVMRSWKSGWRPPPSSRGAELASTSLADADRSFRDSSLPSTKGVGCGRLSCEMNGCRVASSALHRSSGSIYPKHSRARQ